MRLIEIMQSLGDHLGILERAAPATFQSPAKIVTRRVTLAELMAEIPADQVRALAELPAELTVSLAQVYSAAGIKDPAHGWTIEKLGALLGTERFQKLDRPAIQKSILEVLANENAMVEDLVKDAVARDKALDAFEDFVRRKVRDRTISRERRISELESRIRDLRKEQEELRAMAAADARAWAEWRANKRLAEKHLAQAVGYLIDEQVITTDEGDNS